MIARLQHRDEQGSTLIVALAFLSLFGVFIAAILAQVSTNMRLTGTTRDRADRLFAADAGLEWGVQQARGQDTACANVAVGDQTLTSTLNVNGRAITVTCEALAGAVASPAAQQWSVIAPGGIVNTAPGATVAGGDVWAGGADPTTDIVTSAADVVRGQATCLLFSLTGLTVGVPDTSSCSTSAAPDVPHNLPPAPAIRENATRVMCGGNEWRIWHPGKYTLLAQPDAGPFNYLESGVYYFEGLSVNLSNTVTVGGKPATGDTSVLAGECAGIDDTAAGAASRASGSGVSLILGGASNIRIGGGAGTKVELYTRAPAAADATPGISVLTVPSTGAGYVGWLPGLFPAFGILSELPRVAVHGLVYARNAPVTIYTNSTAPLLAGVVASTLTIVPGAGGTKAVEASGRRTLLLTSTADPASPGEIAAVQSAVVKIANDPTRTASVRSWRAQ
jgi:Tfp pilus assembly protein PilX